MDYPPPILTIDETGTKLILNKNSYMTDIGWFDKVAINYGYREYIDSDEKNELIKLIDDATVNGYVFLTDQDSDLSSSDWRSSKWDRGNDPINSLNNSLLIRQIALEQLSERSIPFDAPISRILDIFPIVYLWHRYEVEACAKLIGGYYYQYSLKGDQYDHFIEAVPKETQLLALQQLLKSIEPKQLSISTNLFKLLMPNAFGYVSDIGGLDDWYLYYFYYYYFY